MFKRKNYYILFSLALIGIAILLFATRWGIGISPDSTIYIAAARNLLNGLGLSTVSGIGEVNPMVDYPPLFPILLSIIGSFGVDPLYAARWLNILLFGANIFLVGLVINRNIWTSVFGSFLMLSSVVIFDIHSMAWTEPLFIFLSLLGLFLLASYIDNPKPSLLIASSGVIALAFITRYIGVALVATGVIGILFLNTKSYRRRVGDTVIFITISLLPISLWIIRNLRIANALTNKGLVFHPITIDYLRFLLSSISIWLLPAMIPGIMRGIILLILSLSFLVLSLVILRNKNKLKEIYFNLSHLKKFYYLLITFILVYAIFLAVSISFYSAHTPLDNRILSPVYIAMLILTLCIADSYIKKSNFFKITYTLICIILGASYLLRGTNWVIHASSDGQGYSNRAWQNSPIMRRIKMLPPKIPIFTNGADAVYILADRAASFIPSKVNNDTLRLNDGYLTELARMRKQLEHAKGVLIYFNTITERWYLPSENELKEQLPLCPIAVETDGTIYEVEQ